MQRLNTIQVINNREAELLRLNRRVLDESPDLIAVIGTDFKCYYVNPAYVAAHNRKPVAFIGHHVRDFLGDELFETVVRPNIEACVSGEAVQYESWFDFGRPGVFFMEVRYLPLHDANGDIDRVVIVTRDITAKKEAENIRIDREKLKTVVELAGTYNHEINNPLTSLTGTLELLLEDETDESRRNRLESALAEARRIADVTRKIEETTSLTVKDYAGGDSILDLSGNEA